MFATNVSNQVALRYNPAAQLAFNGFLSSIGIDSAIPFSAENFAVKMVELLTDAETALPDAQKQNNFGYSIGEGGAYRATIKAAVTTSFQVVA